MSVSRIKMNKKWVKVKPIVIGILSLDLLIFQIDVLL